MKNIKANKVKKRHHSIEIINESSISIPINLVKIIERLLNNIPSDHLIGLSCITIVDKFHYKSYTHAAGLYWKKSKSTTARIELSVTGIYNDHPYSICLVPFVRKYLLARTLFHEIGHHYIHRLHGIPKIEWEEFAKNYSKKFLYKAFYCTWNILRPFEPMISWLGNRLTR